jgi:hypothetical protein
MTNNIDNPCPRNPNHEYIPTTIWYLDDFGQEVEQEDCANCQEDSHRRYREQIENASNVDASEIMEKYQEELKKQSPPTPEFTRKHNKDYNIIDRYATRLMESTDAPMDVCKAMVEFDISVALHKLFFADGKGRVLPNTAYIWLAPSGNNKTPLYEWGIMRLQDQLFSEWKYYHFNRVGGKALISSLSKVKQDDLVHGRILSLLTLDEASTMAKDSNADGLSDMFESFAQAYDGQLMSSTTVVRKHEKPRPCYSPIWFQGTPTFLKYVNEDFWDIGLGNRMFFLKFTASEIKPIPKTLHSKDFYTDIIADLEIMREIETANFTDEAWDRYNEYQMKVMEEIRDVQTDLESSIDSNNFPIVSKVKMPIHIIKLALIISASRFNFDTTGLLKVELQDVNKAIEEVEFYHSNMVYIHQIWETQSAQRLRHESVEMLAKKIFNHINSIISKDGGYDIKFHKPDNQSEDGYWVAEQSKEGKWVRHSVLLKKSHMKASGLRSFEEVVETLIAREELIKREAKVYFIDGNKKRNAVIVDFYRIKD